MPLLSSYIKDLSTSFYLKTDKSSNCQIRELGKYDPASDKHRRPYPSYQDNPYTLVQRMYFSVPTLRKGLRSTYAWSVFG
jgi:hypothetical protein